MNWFLNTALTNFRKAVNTRWPNRDKASDGTIGDTAHASRTSDHNPDPDGSVDAWDMDVDGVDVELLKQVFQAHESSAYWIHNDQIARRSSGWRRESYAYAGPDRNRHTKHVHWNTRSTHEDSTKPWVIPAPPAPPAAEEDDMKLIIAREESDPKVYVGNGVTRRHIKTETDLGNLRWWLKNKRGYSDAETEVNVFDDGTLAGVLGALVEEPAAPAEA